MGDLLECCDFLEFGSFLCDEGLLKVAELLGRDGLLGDLL